MKPETTINLPETGNENSVFAFEGFNVRVAGTPDEPLFIAKDVCDVLGISNSRQALSRLDDDEKNDVILNDAIGRSQSTAAVNEFGLYALIGSSRKESAKKFQHWVNHEVLPSIRKTGSYGNPKLPETLDASAILQIGQTMARLELEVKQKSAALELKDEQLAINAPAVQYAIELMDSDSLLTMTLVAKPLGTSAVTMNRFLHDRGVIHKVSGEWVPYAKYQNTGHFQIVKRTVEIPERDGVKTRTCGQLKVTAIGSEFIHRLWREKKVA